MNQMTTATFRMFPESTDTTETAPETTEREVVVRCLRCNRVLKDPVSVEYRMGPVCRRGRH
jgi:hypothetical protein